MLWGILFVIFFGLLMVINHQSAIKREKEEASDYAEFGFCISPDWYYADEKMNVYLITDIERNIGESLGSYLSYEQDVDTKVYRFDFLGQHSVSKFEYIGAPKVHLPKYKICCGLYSTEEAEMFFKQKFPEEFI